MLAISPHLDDAVLSLGGRIANSTIATVFAGIPPVWPWPAPFDSASGFEHSHEAVVARRLEDHAAARRLACTVEHLEFLDGQYHMPADRRDDLDGLGAALDRLFHENRKGTIAVPLGLAHPDHRFVAEVARGALVRWPRAFIVYADLPSARLWPGHLPGAIAGWQRAGFQLEAISWPVHLGRKREAVDCYTSQRRFPELAHDNLTEERGWRAKWVGTD